MEERKDFQKVGKCWDLEPGWGGELMGAVRYWLCLRFSLCKVGGMMVTPSALCAAWAHPPSLALLSVSPQLSSPGLPALPLLTADVPGPGALGNIPWFAADCPAPRSLRCGQSGRRPGGRGPGAGETMCPPNPTPAPGTRRGRQLVALTDGQRDPLGRWGRPSPAHSPPRAP